ncbi:hypothetical protein [Candidatus Poriferisodalis multihospitum]|uniref:hypothetical protein n=1 Tax=Candidatus Poriferisodalis multihospitum TaxID=2983191 RepID=UPI002385EF5A|nr:hypothetical protein [Candidatus Poriferisodalis multihospitum]MDE0318296.1 hypothetical protein [Acidimicrobiaceae bacterium]
MPASDVSLVSRLLAARSLLREAARQMTDDQIAELDTRIRFRITAVDITLPNGLHPDSELAVSLLECLELIQNERRDSS